MPWIGQGVHHNSKKIKQRDASLSSHVHAPPRPCSRCQKLGEETGRALSQIGNRLYEQDHGGRRLLCLPEAMIHAIRSLKCLGRTSSLYQTVIIQIRSITPINLHVPTRFGYAPPDSEDVAGVQARAGSGTTKDFITNVIACKRSELGSRQIQTPERHNPHQFGVRRPTQMRPRFAFLASLGFLSLLSGFSLLTLSSFSLAHLSS